MTIVHPSNYFILFFTVDLSDQCIVLIGKCDGMVVKTLRLAKEFFFKLLICVSFAFQDLLKQKGAVAVQGW